MATTLFLVSFRDFSWNKTPFTFPECLATEAAESTQSQILDLCGWEHGAGKLSGIKCPYVPKKVCLTYYDTSFITSDKCLHPGTTQQQW